MLVRIPRYRKNLVRIIQGWQRHAIWADVFTLRSLIYFLFWIGWKEHPIAATEEVCSSRGPSSIHTRNHRHQYSYKALQDYAQYAPTIVQVEMVYVMTYFDSGPLLPPKCSEQPPSYMLPPSPGWFLALEAQVQALNAYISYLLSTSTSLSSSRYLLITQAEPFHMIGRSLRYTSRSMQLPAKQS